MTLLFSRRQWTAFILSAALVLSLPVIAFAAAPASARFSDSPLQFEPHPSQASSASYIARGSGSTILVSPTSVTVSPANNGRQLVRVDMLGADPKARDQALDLLPGTVNYILGNDPANWRTKIPIYAKLRYEEIYPKIDAVYYGQNGRLEYDFVVAPGGDPRLIRMAATGGHFRLDHNGDLVIGLASGELRWQKPNIYQDSQNGRKIVAGNYVLGSDGVVSFTVGPYDHARTLCIDPVITYATYLGGSYTDEIFAAAMDKNGNAYVTGRTESPDFPFSSTVANFNSKHAFVVKYAPDGTRIYSVYVGGTDGEDAAMSIAVDAAGSPYLVGTTNATNFPTTPNSFAPSCTLTPSNTCLAAFLAKLKPDGSGMAYSTYISGGFNTETTTAAFDEGYAAAVDDNGMAYAGGGTQSAHFPTTSGAFQTTFGGAGDAWVMKFDTSKSGSASLLWSTYLGGVGTDTLYGIAVDPAGNVYAGGETWGNFPVKNAIVPNAQGLRDGFIAKLNPSGSALVYSTYLGGSDTDVVMGVAADPDGNAYATGQTKSPDFPLHSPVQPMIGGGEAWGKTTGDAYVAKISPTGNAFVYSTFLGGLSFDWGQAIAADASGNAYVTGLTDSAEFPTVSGATETWHGGNDHAFYTQLSADGKLNASTFVGTYGQGNAVAVDPQGNVLIAGVTSGTDFPTKDPAQPQFGGGLLDGFVVKMAPNQWGNADLNLAVTATPDFANSKVTYNITVTNTGPYVASGIVVRDVLPAGASFYSASAPLECFGVAPVCKIGGLPAGGHDNVSFTASLSTGANLVNTASVAAYTYDPNLSDNQQTTLLSYATADLRTSIAANPTTARVGQDLNITATVTNAGPDTASDVVVTHTPPPNVTVVSLPGGCSGSNPIRCNVGTLAKDATATLTFVQQPTSTADMDETFNSHATAIDPDLMSNGTWMHIPVWTATTADLKFEMTTSPATVLAGGKLNVTMKVTNTGTSAASQVHITAPDPSVTNYDSVVAGQWTCSHVRLQLDCTLPTLAAGANSSLTVTYVIEGSSFVTGSAQVAAAETDPTPIDNSANFFVTVMDYDIGAATGSASVRPGQPATYTINVDPKPLNAALDSAITFTCSGLPNLSACSFSPASVTPGTARASTTLTITTTAPSVGALRPMGSPWYGVTVFAAALPFLGVIGGCRRRSRWLVLMILLMIVISMNACGGGGGGSTPIPNPRPGTTPGTYTVTVTAAASTASHSTTVTLTVQ